MIEKNFSVAHEFKNAWKTLKGNFLIFILVTISMMIISLGFNKIAEGYTLSNISLSNFYKTISGIIELVIVFGMFNMSLKAVRGIKVVWNDLFQKIHILGKYLWATILYGLILLIGFIPFMAFMFYYVFNTTGTLVTQNFSFDTAPPVISFFAFATFLFALVWYILISIKYQFYSFVLIDKNLKIKDVFKKSASISNGVRIQLFSMLVLLVLINILVSFTTFGFGFILSLPFSILVLASVYQKLSLTMDSNEALKRVDPATMATLPRVE